MGDPMPSKDLRWTMHRRLIERRYRVSKSNRCSTTSEAEQLFPGFVIAIRDCPSRSRSHCWCAAVTSCCSTFVRVTRANLHLKRILWHRGATDVQIGRTRSLDVDVVVEENVRQHELHLLAGEEATGTGVFAEAKGEEVVGGDDESTVLEIQNLAEVFGRLRGCLFLSDVILSGPGETKGVPLVSAGVECIVAVDGGGGYTYADTLGDVDTTAERDSFGSADLNCTRLVSVYSRNTLSTRYSGGQTHQSRHADFRQVRNAHGFSDGGIGAQEFIDGIFGPLTAVRGQDSFAFFTQSREVVIFVRRGVQIHQSVCGDDAGGVNGHHIEKDHQTCNVVGVAFERHFLGSGQRFVEDPLQDVVLQMPSVCGRSQRQRDSHRRFVVVAELLHFLDPTLDDGQGVLLANAQMMIHLAHEERRDYGV